MAWPHSKLELWACTAQPLHASVRPRSRDWPQGWQALDRKTERIGTSCASAHHVCVRGQVVLAVGVGAALASEQHATHSLRGGRDGETVDADVRAGRLWAGQARPSARPSGPLHAAAPPPTPHLRLALADGARVLGAQPALCRLHLRIHQAQAVGVVGCTPGCVGGGKRLRRCREDERKSAGLAGLADAALEQQVWAATAVLTMSSSRGSRGRLWHRPVEPAPHLRGSRRSR